MSSAYRIGQNIIQTDVSYTIMHIFVKVLIEDFDYMWGYSKSSIVYL